MSNENETFVVDPTIRDIISAVGSVFVIFLFTAPLKDIRIVYHQKHTRTLVTGLPYFSTLFNCCAWTCYTLPEFYDYILPTLINIYGILAAGAYSYVYYKYCAGSEVTFCRRLFVAGTIFISVGVILQIIFGREVMGFMAAGLNIVMYYSPLAAASEVIRKMSVEKMPFLPLLMGFLSGVSWFAYGLYTRDLPISIPNGIGVCFGAIQLSIYFYVLLNKKTSLPGQESNMVSFSSSSSSAEVVRATDTKHQSVDVKTIDRINEKEESLPMKADVPCV